MTTPKITQAMIDAYDEYTHLTLDRRGFMEKLTKLAGSAAAAAAIAPLACRQFGAARRSSPADDGRLKAEETITWPGTSGDDEGLSGASRPTAPASCRRVIVIHENRGLNPHIRDVARRVALEGFVALGAGSSVAARRHAGRRGEGARRCSTSSTRRRRSPTAWRRSTT